MQRFEFKKTRYVVLKEETCSFYKEDGILIVEMKQHPNLLSKVELKDRMVKSSARK